MYYILRNGVPGGSVPPGVEQILALSECDGVRAAIHDVLLVHRTRKLLEATCVTHLCRIAQELIKAGSKEDTCFLQPFAEGFVGLLLVRIVEAKMAALDRNTLVTTRRWNNISM